MSGAHSDLSDSELDALYADVYQSYSMASGMNKATWSEALIELTREILERLRNPFAFVYGYFGGAKFPKYDEIQANNPSLYGFRQAAVAQESVKENASATAREVGGGIGWGLGGAALIGLTVLAVVVAVKLK